MMRHFVRCMSFFNVAFLFSTAVVKFTALVPNVQAADLTLDCPAPETWVDGPTNITCTLDSTRFTPAVCTGVRLDNLRFLFQANGSASAVIDCQATAFESSCNGNINADGCGCIQFANGLYTFSYNFTAEKGVHSGGSWNCKPTCVDGSLNDALTTDVGVGCDPVVFYEPTAPPTTESTSESTAATTPPPPECCKPWTILVTFFGCLRLFCIISIFAAWRQFWPIEGDGARACFFFLTIFVSEPFFVYIIFAAIKRQWPFGRANKKAKSWEILTFHIGLVMCSGLLMLIILGSTCDLNSLDNEACPDEGWKITLLSTVVAFLGVFGLCWIFSVIKYLICIGKEKLGLKHVLLLIAIIICLGWIVYAVFAYLRKLWPFCPPERLLVKCGECHKWRRFTVKPEDHTLQDIFIQPNLDNIFKKCANHDQGELSFREVKQIIQNLTKHRIGDIRNVTLVQTICLKDHSLDKWYKQDGDIGQAVLDDAKEGTWSWSEGAGTEVEPEELKDVLQIRLYLQSKMFYKLRVKCGECHKWYLFSVTLDDKKLQNIFIQENLNEIFKKCASHGQEEFSLEKVEQKIQEILRKCGMGDIGNMKLVQTICLKDHSLDKWYKEDHDPGKTAVAHAKEGTWEWSYGAGTAVEPEELKDVLQIRLYLQSERFYKLLAKCGKCHKWRLFSVALDDNKLQNIFIQENLNEIFKKCANHGQEEFDLQEVEQKLEEILSQYQNVTLHQTICLKGDWRDKWYKQHHKPNKAVLDAVMKGKWSWSEGFGTEVDQTGMIEVLQIRLYLLSTSAFREHGGAIEMRRVDDVSSSPDKQKKASKKVESEHTHSDKSGVQ